MKSWLPGRMLAATIALPALSGAAWAQDVGCSNATLNGNYAFGVTAYTPPGLPNGPPRVVTGIKEFDGHGNLIQRDYQGDNLAGPDFAPPGQEKGTYQVSSDCTGNMVINLNAFGVPPVTTQGGGYKDQFCDQRRRQSYPRSRLRIHSAGILWTRAPHSNQWR